MRSVRRFGCVQVARAYEGLIFFLLLKGNQIIRRRTFLFVLSAAEFCGKIAVVVLLYRQLFPTAQFYFFTFAFVLISVRSVVVLHPTDCGQYEFFHTAYCGAIGSPQLASDFAEAYRFYILVEIIEFLRKILRAVALLAVSRYQFIITAF